MPRQTVATNVDLNWSRKENQGEYVLAKTCELQSGERKGIQQ